MIVLCSFRVHTESGQKESPSMGCVDLEKLKKLFPDSLVWPGSGNNIIHINLEQAKILYSDMMALYAKNEISDEKYISGGAFNAFQIGSDLQSLINSLVDFFEKDLGFSSSPEIAKAVSDKRVEQDKKAKAAKAKIREEVAELFKTFGVLKPPKNDEIRIGIEKKLVEYRTRLQEVRHHPQIARYISVVYRDSLHKVAVCEAVLSAMVEVQVADLALKQLDVLDECFDSGEFLQAAGVIAGYLETPFPGTEVIPSRSTISA